MTALWATIISFLTGALGGVIGAYFQARFQRGTQIGQHQHELKQKRYLSIMILMLTKLNPDAQMPKTREARPDLRNSEDIDSELTLELLNGFVFASDEMLKMMSEFIRRPDYPLFIRTAVAMRKDLWGKRTEINEDILDVVGFFRDAKKHIAVKESSLARYAEFAEEDRELAEEGLTDYAAGLIKEDTE